MRSPLVPLFLASERLADVPSGGRCAESLEEGYLEVIGHDNSVRQLCFLPIA
jgi:hypothetical protein